MKSIEYNGFNLQTGNILTSNVIFEDVDNAIITSQFAFRDGSKILNIAQKSKQIVLYGTLVGVDASTLEFYVDNLKKLSNYKEKVLSIEYQQGVREYIATIKEITFDRKGFTINSISFKIVFFLASPFAISPDETWIELGIHNVENVGSELVQVYSVDNLVFQGTKTPLAYFDITFDNYNGVAVVEEFKIIVISSENFQTSCTAVLTDTAVDGKNFIVDLNENTVYEKNSVTQIFFRDGFPKIELAENDFFIYIKGHNYTVDVKIKYRKRYL